MIAPEYSYYLGKLFSSEDVQEGFWLGPDGELSPLEGMYASSLLKLASPYLYFDKKLTSLDDPNDLAYICFYDESKNLIARQLIYTLWAGSGDDIIDVRNIAGEKVEYFAFSFFAQENKPLIDYTLLNSGSIYNIFKVNPSFKTLSKKYAKENNQIFFRESLDGKITLLAPDFNIFNTFTINDSLIFTVFKFNNDYRINELYYKAALNKTDCQIDYSKRSVELKLNALDPYTNILNHYEDKYDLIKLAPAIEKVNIHKRGLIQAYILGANTVSNFVGGTYWESEVNEVIDDFDKLKQYQFAYCLSANEFYISGADYNSEIDGVYAGTNGIYRNTNGYVCEVQRTSSGRSWYLIIRKENSADILYKSSSYFIQVSSSNIYFSPEQLETVAFINQKNTQGEFAAITMAFVHHVHTRLLCDVSQVQDSSGSVQTVDLPIDDFTADSRNFKKCIGLSKIKVYCSAKFSDTPTKYGINDYGQYFSDKFISYTTGLGRPLPICRNAWVNASIWFVYDNFYGITEQSVRKKYKLKDCFSIANAIKVLLSKIEPTIQHEATAEYSQFLYADNNPVLNSEKFYVYLTQKSNVLKGDYDQAAQKAEITFKTLMDMLRDCFRCYWYIDNNKLKIEHIKYFSNGGSYTAPLSSQFDFITTQDRFNKNKVSYFQSKVEFNKNSLASRYEFAWMDEVTDIFSNVTIDIADAFVTKNKTEAINASQFTSDIDYMLFNPSSISNDGFALLCPVKVNEELELPIVTVTDLVDEENNSYAAYAQNYFASWPFLLGLYRYDMPGFKAKASCFKDYFVTGLKRCMEQDIELQLEKDPDLLKSIITQFGEGIIDEVSINLLTRLAKIKLVYPPS